MMFLVQGELKGACPLPAKAWMERVVRELEMSVEHEQSGKALAGGTYVGRKGGCLILDVQSVDELNALVSRFPLHPFIDWEVIPLVSFEKSLQGAKQALASIG